MVILINAVMAVSVKSIGIFVDVAIDAINLIIRTAISGIIGAIAIVKIIG